MPIIAGARRRRAEDRRRWSRRRSQSSAQTFPPGCTLRLSPTTPPPSSSCRSSEVVKTLVEAVVLVVLVMFVFLQNWRATLIPAIAVPVVLLGTFGVFAVAGFTHQHADPVRPGAGDRPAGRRRHRRGRERRAADGRGARHVARARRRSSRWTRSQSALIAIALVLSAVFLPMAFFGGSTGRDLPPVLDHHRLGDGAVGAGRADPDARRSPPPCSSPQADGEAPRTTASRASRHRFGDSVQHVVPDRSARTLRARRSTA